MKKINIAIDGFSGTGKSSTAKAVARSLGYTYLDTGAMYRAVTLYFLQNHITPEDLDRVEASLKNIHIDFKWEGRTWITFLNGNNVETQIRSMEVTSQVSNVSKLKPVRTKLVAMQQQLAANGGIVMDGRDIGTVVLPDAELKVFMTANVNIRTERRWLELKEKGEEAQREEIRENLEQRDRLDSSRSVSPLKKADGAVELDTSHITFEEQVKKIVDLAKKKMEGKGT